MNDQTTYQTPGQLSLDLDQQRPGDLRLIVAALFAVAPCEDSPEPGRACRYCEAVAVRDVLDAKGRLS